jgi:predicted NBD/HSP70 family sugar kinase
MRSRDARSAPRRRDRAERDSLARVLNLIRSGRAATRQEIQSLAGLGRAVVADRVATLIARGLVVEGPPGASTGGRAPTTVQLNASAGAVIVGSVGTTTLGVGLADLSGNLLVEHHEPADTTLGAERTLLRLTELFDWLLDDHASNREAWAIALAVPGLVGPTGGRLGARPTLRHMPGWTDFPVAEHLSDRYGAPVLVDSEVHFMAFGELRAGHGVGRDELIFVKVGTGISAGLCSDGRIHRGVHGYAGDIGHVAVTDDGATICRCGNTGCLEALAGGLALAREGLAAARDGRSEYLADQLASGDGITATHVGMGAIRGDPVSVELISRSGRLIGETLVTLIAGYDPSIVVVGGGVAQAGAILMAAIREGIYRRSRSLATDNLMLVRSELGKTAGLIGGAQAALEDLFADHHLDTWIEYGSPRLPVTGGTGRSGRDRRAVDSSAGGGSAETARVAPHVVRTGRT